MRRLNIVLILLIGLSAGLILYFCRQIFFYKYEPEYYENYYYNSQWNVVGSSRGLSDGELYKFVGYRLVEGENPFNINYEVPPLAKYLYGLGERFLGNPYWISIGFYLAGAVAIYFLGLELFGGVTVSLLGALLFVTMPFLATQVKETMLDLPLTVLLLFSVLFMVKYINVKMDSRLRGNDKVESGNDRIVHLILAGIFLGLFTGTKIGVYTPFALVLGVIISMLISKKWLSGVIYVFSSVAGYVLSFFCYFIKHPNPLPWLRLHEKPFDFYLKSAGGNVDYWNQWRGIFLNSYKGFWVGAESTGLGDWSMIIPMGVVFSVLILWFSLKKRDYSWIYLVLLSYVILGVNTAVPFWARYLMPATPLFILFVLYFLRERIFMIVLLAILNLGIVIPTLTSNGLPGHTNAVERFLNTRAYRELYRSIDEESRLKYSEEKFQATMENFYLSLKIKKNEVQIENSEIISKYETHLGVINSRQKAEFKKEHNQWKLIWNWKYLYSEFDPDENLDIKKILPGVEVEKRTGVYVIPRLMYDWGQYSSALNFLTRLGNKVIDAKVRETIPDDFPRFIGYLQPDVPKDIIAKNTLSGIRFKEEEVAK